jgi:hypothetical protein
MLLTVTGCSTTAAAAAAGPSYSRQMAAEVCAPALLAGLVTKPGGHLLQVGCCFKPRLYSLSPHGGSRRTHNQGGWYCKQQQQGSGSRSESDAHQSINQLHVF